MNLTTSWHSLRAGLAARIDAWVKRHLVDVDPHPVLSRLDRLDGLAAGRDRTYEDRDPQLLDASQDVAS